MNREIEERVSQIVDFAESTNREISYEMVLDILQDKGLQDFILMQLLMMNGL